MDENKVICDTDVMIDFWDVDQPRHTRTKETLQELIGLNNIMLSAITKMELLMGVKNKSELYQLNKKLNRFDTILINDDISAHAILILQMYRLSHGLEIPDSLIAATAIVGKYPLFTYNLKDYKFIQNIELLST